MPKEMEPDTGKKYKLDVVGIRLVQESPIYSDVAIQNPEDAVKLLGDVMRQFDREVFAVLNLTAQGRPLNVSFVSTGTIDGSYAMPRDVLKASILSNAAQVVVLHNHPSGIPEPSIQDTQTTSRMIDAYALLGIRLSDHIIVGDQLHGYFSFMMKGYMHPPELSLVSDYHELDLGTSDDFRKDFAQSAESYFRTLDETPGKPPEKPKPKAKPKPRAPKL